MRAVATILNVTMGSGLVMIKRVTHSLIALMGKMKKAASKEDFNYGTNKIHNFNLYIQLF